MAQDHHQGTTQVFDGVDDGGQAPSVNRIAGDPDDEQTPQALVEQDGRRRSAVGASDDRRDRLLAALQGFEVLGGDVAELGLAAQEGRVAGLEQLKGLRRCW